MYMRERMAAGATDVRTKAVYEGLLDVLDPTRRTARLQRERRPRRRPRSPCNVRESVG